MSKPTKQFQRNGESFENPLLSQCSVPSLGFKRIPYNGEWFEAPVVGPGSLPGSVIMRGEDIYKSIGAPKDVTVVRVNPQTQEHEVTPAKGEVEIGPYDEFTTVERHINAGRNQKRLNTELTVLQDMYGVNNVCWPPRQEWVMIRKFNLPNAKQYNHPDTPLVIIIPQNYGHGVPIRDCFVAPGLRIRRNGRWREIPNYHEGGYAPSGGSQWKTQGWTYLCLHALEWPQGAWFETYIKMLRTFLSDPFASMYRRRG